MVARFWVLSCELGWKVEVRDVERGVGEVSVQVVVVVVRRSQFVFSIL